MEENYSERLHIKVQKLNNEDNIIKKEKKGFIFLFLVLLIHLQPLKWPVLGNLLVLPYFA